MSASDVDIERVARALDHAPRAAYTAPLVYPWSVGHFEARPLTERPRLGPDPLRLYVHVPFCNYRCSFCFFAVRVGAGHTEMERYIAALEREIEWIAPRTPLAQLFVGGGTPTALPAELLGRLLTKIFERTESPDAGAVHTLEASPESIREAHLRVLQDHGIGRVSMGIETLDDGVLDTVRRRNHAAETLGAMRMVVDSGRELNADLIYGLPGQTEASFQRDVETVAATGVSSLCLYALRLNESTRIGTQLTDDESLGLGRLMRWRAFVKQTAEQAGFEQVRCYLFKRRSQPGDGLAPAREATRAGTAGHQLGVGMSARSQLEGTVYRNHERSKIYVERMEQGSSPVETVFPLDLADRKTQFVAASLGNGLPLDRRAYERIFSTSFEADFGDVLVRLRGGDLVAENDAGLCLTEIGKLVYDRILLCFYPPRARAWLSGPAQPKALRA